MKSGRGETSFLESLTLCRSILLYASACTTQREKRRRRIETRTEPANRPFQRAPRSRYLTPPPPPPDFPTAKQLLSRIIINLKFPTKESRPFFPRKDSHFFPFRGWKQIYPRGNSTRSKFPSFQNCEWRVILLLRARNRASALDLSRAQEIEIQCCRLSFANGQRFGSRREFLFAPPPRPTTKLPDKL